jgi:hypothetical protein
MKKIFLLLMVMSSISIASFSRTADKIVIDSNTTLQWQDNELQNGETSLGWEAAIDHCEALTLGGHQDWRLPNIKELKSIVDRTRVNPAIPIEFVWAASGNPYWSSTTFSSNHTYAWAVFFNNGNAADVDKINTRFVRCVR